MTDHNPLVWLNRNVSSNPRLMRWALALQPYNFRIVHRSVKTVAYLAKARKDDLKTLATELGLEIGEMMRDLVLTDQLKKIILKEVKEHFVDIWGNIKSSSELVQKLDDYEIARGKTSNHKVLSDVRTSFHSKINKQIRTVDKAKEENQENHLEDIRNLKAEILCPAMDVENPATSRAAFVKTVISLSFADGIVSQKEVLRTFQTVILEDRKFKTPFIILPGAQNNSTLLGVDFLENAGIVLNFRKNCWTFCDDSRKSYNFVTPYQSTSLNVRPVEINNCQLREDEGQELLGFQRAELDSLLKNHNSIFEVGREATPFIEHSINTENNPPISVPPYRMNPAKKELLKKELDSLLQQGIIVECESPYASPVLLIPKPNGSMRLYIDYRKLNAQTVGWMTCLTKLSQHLICRLLACVQDTTN
ncbi:retrovirus-related Pol polyprotein from transposon 17.6 [Trichonephila clavipes]|nr:retrovirus-related Pol polyprotein from transposon 17.6 [Trichonephila clavipes]